VHAAEVLTNNYDKARTGANLEEIQLTTLNVNPKSFGKIRTHLVDAPVFAQPLVATKVQIPDKGEQNVLYIVTGNNSVYAFDANSPTLFWTASLGPPAKVASLTETARTVPHRIEGIRSTPVIDRASNTIFVVSATSSGRGLNWEFQLHALSLDTGAARVPPVVIAGAVSVGGKTVEFGPSDNPAPLQRPGLALAGEHVIVAFGSWGDAGFYHGWLFAFDRMSLARTGVFCTTCASTALSPAQYADRSACTIAGPGGGIWQGGRAPTVDENNFVYVFTGNKVHQSNAPCASNAGDNFVLYSDGIHSDTNESLLKLNPAAGLRLEGWFQPQNWNWSRHTPELEKAFAGLEAFDLDLSSSGPTLIPNTNSLLGGGKQGVMYLFNTNGLNPANQIPPQSPAVEAVQSFQIVADAVNPIPGLPYGNTDKDPDHNKIDRHIMGGPVVWTRSSAEGGTRIYVWRENDFLRSYSMSETEPPTILVPIPAPIPRVAQFANCSRINPPPSTNSICNSADRGNVFMNHHPAGILALSANHGLAQSGIVWAITASAHPAFTRTAHSVLRAFDATNLSIELWNSDRCLGDWSGMSSQFAPPTVANGKVYVATTSNRVAVYGLKQKASFCPEVEPIWDLITE
jgi:outer membrane protein assembly factor BamB